MASRLQSYYAVAMLFTLRPLDTIINFVESHKHLGITLAYNGQWHTHLETILSSAHKVLGTCIMRKLKYRFTRQALNQMYVSYVRLPLYGMAVQNKTKLLWNGFKMKPLT